MVLAAVDYFQRYTQLLHHRRARATQVMRCPLSLCAFVQYKRIVVMSACKGLAAILEVALSITYQFADRLGIDMVFLVLAGETEGRVSGFPLQSLELCQRKR